MKTPVGEMTRESIFIKHIVTDEDGSLKINLVEEFTDSKAYLDAIDAVAAAKAKGPYFCVPHDGKAVCYESKFVYDPLQNWNEGSTLSHDLDGVRPPCAIHNPLFRLPIKTTDHTNGKFPPIAPYAVDRTLAFRAPCEDKYRVITGQSSLREVRGDGWKVGSRSQP